MAFSYSEITSRKNEKIIWVSKLCDKKNRDASGLFITDGSKLLEEALLSGLCVEKVFFTKKAFAVYEDLLTKAEAKESILVSDEVFEKLTDEKAPQGILSVIKKPCEMHFHGDALKDGGFLILEDIQNPLNLGAIFRCAYSLGCTKLILSRKCSDIYNPKTLRSAMGSAFKVGFEVCDDIGSFIDRQKLIGNRVFCTHLHSESKKLGSFGFLPGDSIVIGNEGHGVSDRTVALCDGSVIIPMTEGAESLNAATAASILIWEMNKAKLIN